MLQHHFGKVVMSDYLIVNVQTGLKGISWKMADSIWPNIITLYILLISVHLKLFTSLYQAPDTRLSLAAVRFTV